MTTPPACPSLADLLAHADDLSDHVASCARCRTLLATRSTAAAAPATADAHPDTPRRAPALGGRRRAPVVAGQLVEVAYADLDEYLIGLVLEARDGDALVAPISDEVDLATDRDVLLDATVLGYPAMAQTALAFLVLAEQLHDVLATVERYLSDAAVQIARDLGAGAHLAPSVAVGPAVQGDDDPRLLFGDAERQRVAPYATPARLLSEGADLGAVIHARRHVVGLRDDEADAVLGARGRIGELEAGTADLEHDVAPGALLVLLRRLGVELHEGTARLIGAVVAAGGRAVAPPQRTTALLRVAARNAEPLDDAPRRARAQSYLDELWSANS